MFGCRPTKYPIGNKLLHKTMFFKSIKIQNNTFFKFKQFKKHPVLQVLIKLNEPNFLHYCYFPLLLFLVQECEKPFFWKPFQSPFCASEKNSHPTIMLNNVVRYKADVAKLRPAGRNCHKLIYCWLNMR